MGLDGGTLPKRSTLVTTQKESFTSLTELRARRQHEVWTNCAISGKELVEPIVACGKGRLYNKEFVLEEVISRKQREKARKKAMNGENFDAKMNENSFFQAVPHIKKLSHMVTLKLFSPRTQLDPVISSGLHSAEKWACPITPTIHPGCNQEFVFLTPCGHVLSHASLCAIRNTKTIDTMSVRCPFCNIDTEYFFIGPSDESSQLTRFLERQMA